MHLVASAIVFISLFTLGWTVSLAFSYLHSVHEFPHRVFELVSRLEVGLIYLDAGVSAIVLVAGITRYLRNVLESE